ncbi:MAG: L-glutamate gamma-semialdehyde dehydrogenase [Alphaproteobacteria bacterium]|nr:L-glutamate gamma-semialdehyde dehydrogenase [Alphaproteobacteria bacterium]
MTNKPIINTVPLTPCGAIPLATTLENLLQKIDWDLSRAQRINASAHKMIAKIRAESGSNSEIETFLQNYSLTSPQGRALMTLAESLLRVPDSATADLLIAEKISLSEWGGTGGNNFFMKSAGIGLGLVKSALGMGSVISSLGKPVIRKAMQETVRHLGGQFVLGQTIEEAMKRAKTMAEKEGLRSSFDILGEGARTSEDADRYFASYKAALEKIGNAADLKKPLESRHGMSVKLSALHPRYTWTHADICVPVLRDHLLELVHLAAQKGVPLTVDAEECERLELSLEIIRQTLEKLACPDWRGFGLAVQAYNRQCLEVIDAVAGFARKYGVTLQVRLVKGAYWDGEIKRAQISGWPDYPVFQRKSQTDLSYLVAAQKLLSYRGIIYPMFATHNAYTAAAILDFAGDDRSGFEFQRLHGMGAALSHILRQDENIPVTVYAPVGPYEDLLPYLVRRMLENGANASFVAKLRDEKTSVDDLVSDPVERVKTETNPEPLPKPREIYSDRKNSQGIEMSSQIIRDGFFTKIPEKGQFDLPLTPPHHQAFNRARIAFGSWNKVPADSRAGYLEKMADLLEGHTPELMALLQDEGKKTLFDAIAEIREAVDFCRYYAQQGRKEFGNTGTELCGPTGEANHLKLSGRGVFVCISPWNFPLAIFLGQVSAALMAGNTVLAKPAEQTPQIAAFAVHLLHQSGIPQDCVIFMNGDGTFGAELVRHPDVAGVAFTGSTDVAHHIQRSLSAKDGPIVPLIAETGGQNAMIVDSTALPEQVVDDVILSAFGSAGQRCSALRILYLQNDVADRIINLLQGAMSQLQIGTSRAPMTDISEVIDKEAQQSLQNHIKYLQSFAKKIAECPVPQGLSGTYFAPCAYEIDRLNRLKGEVFGPILHIIRFDAAKLDQVVDEINATGFGLTFGLQSRLEGRFAELSSKIHAGNIYINRSMIGAVVGVQPFGGQGLSGTGPKAGGPHYLHRFATEQSISNNIMASGGNIDLISRNLD